MIMMIFSYYILYDCTITSVSLVDRNHRIISIVELILVRPGRRDTWFASILTNKKEVYKNKSVIKINVC